MNQDGELLEPEEQDEDDNEILEDEDLWKHFGQINKEQILKINEVIQSSGIIENMSSQITNSMLSDSFKNNPTIAGGFAEVINTKVFNDHMEALARSMNAIWLNQTDKLFFKDTTSPFFDKGWYPLAEVVNQKFDDEKQNVDDFMINSIDTYLKDSEYRDAWMNHQYFREAIMAYEQELYLASSLSSFASIENILSYMFSNVDSRNTNLHRKKSGVSKKQLSSEEFKKELYALLHLPIEQKELIFKQLKEYYGRNRNDISHGKHMPSKTIKVEDLTDMTSVVSKKDAAIAMNAFLLVFFIAQTKQDLIQAIRQDSQFVKTMQNSLVSVNTHIQSSIDWEAISANFNNELLRTIDRINKEYENIEEDKNE